MSFLCFKVYTCIFRNQPTDITHNPSGSEYFMTSVRPDGNKNSYRHVAVVDARPEITVWYVLFKFYVCWSLFYYDNTWKQYYPLSNIADRILHVPDYKQSHAMNVIRRQCFHRVSWGVPGSVPGRDISTGF